MISIHNAVMKLAIYHWFLFVSLGPLEMHIFGFNNARRKGPRCWHHHGFYRKIYSMSCKYAKARFKAILDTINDYH